MSGFFFYDGGYLVGTLKAVVGETGNVIQTIQYDPFGRPLWTDNPALNIPLGFAGGPATKLNTDYDSLL